MHCCRKTHSHHREFWSYDAVGVFKSSSCRSVQSDNGGIFPVLPCVMNQLEISTHCSILLWVTTPVWIKKRTMYGNKCRQDGGFRVTHTAKQTCRLLTWLWILQCFSSQKWAALRQLPTSTLSQFRMHTWSSWSYKEEAMIASSVFACLRTRCHSSPSAMKASSIRNRAAPCDK